MKSRAKDTMPNVLLTLLSILQALALELLWSHLQIADYLFEGDWTRLTFGMQILATFMGILVIWVIYATNVMRFRWVPRISDSVLPFFVGINQFMLIEMLGPGNQGWWFILLAAVFGLMHGTVQLMMRRARLDGDNDAFFQNVSPATLKDFYPTILIVLSLSGLGAYLLARPDAELIALIGALGAFALLSYQLYSVSYFWNRTMSSDEEQVGSG